MTALWRCIPRADRPLRVGRRSRRARAASGSFSASRLTVPMSATGRELPFAANPLERQVSGAEFREAYGSCGSLALLQARDAEGAAFVGHEKERRHRGPLFASDPLPRQNAGRGHRRGLDGPSMPKPLPKTANVFSHLPTRPSGRVGWGFDRRRDRRDAGGSHRSANHVIERGPTASARKKSKLRNPLNPAVQAGFRRTASRRAEPQPGLPLASRPHARSVSSDKRQATSAERQQAARNSQKPYKSDTPAQAVSRFPVRNASRPATRRTPAPAGTKRRVSRA